MHLNIADVSLYNLNKCLPYIMANPKCRTRGSGNPINIVWADKRNEHVALQVIPNFTPQHVPSILGMSCCATEKGKAVYVVKNSV